MSRRTFLGAQRSASAAALSSLRCKPWLARFHLAKIAAILSRHCSSPFFGIFIIGPAFQSRHRLDEPARLSRLLRAAPSLSRILCETGWE